MITVRSTINLAHQSVPEVIPAVQGDTGRSILFSLADFTIPAGATARYFITKPSGLAVYNDATIDGNTVLVDLTAQSLAEYGDCPGQVRIMLGQTVVTSFEFILHVEPFRGIDAVESTTETNIFDKAVEDARDAIAEAAEEAEEYISQALDTTLTIPDKAADAKATGDAISDSADAVIAQMRAEIANVYPTETAQGNPASFDDGADGIPVKDLKVSIVPQQDLHGYDKPWPGGGGKNLLPITVANIKVANGGASSWTNNKKTIGGVEFEIVSDSAGNVTAIKANGTAGANTNLFFATETYPFGVDAYIGSTLIFSGCPSGGSDSTYSMFGWRVKNQSQGIRDTGSGVQFTFDPNVSAWNLCIDIANGYQANNLIFRPMIRLSTVSDATFAPYENLCPITGMTEVEVERTGKNQWDEQWEVGNISAVDGSTVSGDNTIRTKNYIPVSPSTSYFIKSSNSGIYAVFMYAADKAYIGSEEYSNITNHVLTTPSNCRYLKFRNYAGYGVVYNNDISINLPSTDTNYHAYQGQTVTTDLGRTVYGGTLDVTSGVLTVDRAVLDMGALTWNQSTVNQNCFYSNITSYGASAGVLGKLQCLCSHYEAIPSCTFQVLYQHDKCVTIQKGYSTVGVEDTAYSDTVTFTTAMNGVQLVYELATPFTVQLTPQELTTLLGVNNIFTDAESVDVVYRQDIGLILKRMSDSLLPYLPLTRDGIYDLKAEVTGGEKSLYWWTQEISMMSSARPMQTPIADEPVEELEEVEEVTPEEDEED